MARTLRKVERLIFPTSLAQKHQEAVKGSLAGQDDHDSEGSEPTTWNMSPRNAGRTHRESIKSRRPAHKGSGKLKSPPPNRASQSPDLSDEERSTQNPPDTLSTPEESSLASKVIQLCRDRSRLEGYYSTSISTTTSSTSSSIASSSHSSSQISSASTPASSLLTSSTHDPSHDSISRTSLTSLLKSANLSTCDTIEHIIAIALSVPSYPVAQNSPPDTYSAVLSPPYNISPGDEALPSSDSIITTKDIVFTLRLVSHAQRGTMPSVQLAIKPCPLPSLDALFRPIHAILPPQSSTNPTHLHTSEAEPLPAPPKPFLSLTERSLLPSILKEDLGIELSSVHTESTSAAPLTSSLPLNSPLELDTASVIYHHLFKHLPNPVVLSKFVDLRDEKAQAMQNLLDEMATLHPPSSSYALSCHRWMIKLARHSTILPHSLFYKDVRVIPNPSPPGHTGDIYDTDLLDSWLFRRLDDVNPDGEKAYQQPHPVACGGFADIYLGATHKRQLVAIKVLRLFPSDERSRKVFSDFCHEALFWKLLSHPNIVPFLGLSRTLFYPRLAIISSWMHNGNAVRYLARCEKEGRSVDRLSLVLQACRGLAYLHGFTPALIHGDIKGANILINSSGNAMLTDLGLLTVSQSALTATSPGEPVFVRGDTTYTAHSDAGSVRWMAPELFDPATQHVEKEGVSPGEAASSVAGEEPKAGRSTKSDVYAFGMTMLEILTSSVPFKLLSGDLAVMKAILQGDRPVSADYPSRYLQDHSQGFGTSLSAAVWGLMERCWKHLAVERPAIKEVMNVLEDLHVEALVEQPSPSM